MTEPIEVSGLRLTIENSIKILKLRTNIDIEDYLNYYFDGELLSGADVYINANLANVKIYAGNKCLPLENMSLQGHPEFEELFNNSNLQVDIISIAGIKEKPSRDCMIRGQIPTNSEITSNINTKVINPIPDPIHPDLRKQVVKW